MKTGKTFDAFVQTVETTAAHKEDVVARLNECRLASDAKRSVWTINGVGEFEATPVFHQDVASTLRIPTAYHEDCRRNYPALLDANVNSWLKAETDSQYRLLRLLDGRDNGNGIARAIRSTSYLPLDDADLLKTLSPVLDASKVSIQSCEITEKRTFLKVTTPRLRGEVKVGDVVEGGLMISNSEVGHGNITVAPFLNRLICTNGMTTPVAGDNALKRIHRGSTIYTAKPYIRVTETPERQAAIAEIWRAVSEAVGQVLEGASFTDLMERLKAAHKSKLKADGEKLLAHVAQRFELTEAEQQLALANFESESRERSVWGLSNAITKIANDTPSYERASYLESVGGRIIELPPSHWEWLEDLN